MNKLTALTWSGLALLCLLSALWLPPGCQKDRLDGKTTITGRVTEYGTQAPVAGATLYLMCYEGTFGGGGTSSLLDSVRTDADGRYSISFTDCGSTYFIPYKKGYLQHIDVDLGSSKTVDIVLDPEAWLKVVTVPDGQNKYDHIGVGGDFSFEALASQGPKTLIFATRGNRDKVIGWGPFNNPSILVLDTIFVPGHDTTTYAIHY